MHPDAKVLVVDDEEVVRASYLRILAGPQCDVCQVGSGPDALQLMDQQAFDVVLLDQKMPGMDGMAVLQSIKARWPATEVIMITGYPALEAAKQAVRLGACDYLAKPVGPDEVIQAAHSAMAHKRWGLRADRGSGDRAAERVG
ncbi:MAG: response regulator [Rhodoferax sp.]|nr:response regulator [Rhodoferax sp.]